MSVTQTSSADVRQQREQARSQLQAAGPARGLGRGEVVTIEADRAGLLSRAVRKAMRTARCWRWKLRLQALGSKCDIMPHASFYGCQSIRIGERVSIWPYARIEAINSGPGITRVELGDGSAIQPFVHIGAIRSVKVGIGCLFASHVYITDHDHDFSDPNDPPILNNRAIAAPVVIGDYAWLGERVMVLKGVQIGERSIIGAGSIVTKDVPPLSIAVGAPARVIRRWNAETKQWEAVEQS